MLFRVTKGGHVLILTGSTVCASPLGPAATVISGVSESINSLLVSLLIHY